MKALSNKQSKTVTSETIQKNQKMETIVKIGKLAFAIFVAIKCVATGKGGTTTTGTTKVITNY